MTNRQTLLLPIVVMLIAFYFAAVGLALDAGEIETDEALSRIGGDLRDAYFFRLREALDQVEENVEKNFAVRAAEWAGQARGYFNILRADIERKQGPDTVQTIDAALIALEQATINEDEAAVMTHLAEAQAAVANYSPVELTSAEVEKRGQLLYLFTDLVYIEYKDGVRNGQITIAIEYQEAITFRDQAEEELRPMMAATNVAAFVIGSYYLAEYQHKRAKAARRRRAEEKAEMETSTAGH